MLNRNGKSPFPILIPNSFNFSPHFACDQFLGCRNCVIQSLFLNELLINIILTLVSLGVSIIHHKYIKIKFGNK